VGNPLINIIGAPPNYYRSIAVIFMSAALLNMDKVEEGREGDLEVAGEVNFPASLNTSITSLQEQLESIVTVFEHTAAPHNKKMTKEYYNVILNCMNRYFRAGEMTLPLLVSIELLGVMYTKMPKALQNYEQIDLFPYADVYDTLKANPKIDDEIIDKAVDVASEAIDRLLASTSKPIQRVKKKRKGK
jgi:hypothetical protein